MAAIREVFERLGFRRNEIKTYMTALYGGEMNVSELAHRIRLPRSSVQEAVNQLRKKGLMECYLKGRRKFWVAQNPEALLAQIQNHEAVVRQALAELPKPRAHNAPKPAVRLITGLEELISIRSDILQTKQHIYCIVDWDALTRIFSLETLQQVQKEYQDRYLKLYLLVPRTPQAVRLKQASSSEFIKVKFLPANFSFRNAYIVYGHKTVINLLSGSVPLAVCIEDQDLANFFHLVFNFFWEQSN